MKEILVAMGLIALFIFAFFLPAHLVIWCVKSLFGVDWSQKYWQVFFGLAVIGWIFNCARSK